MSSAQLSLLFLIVCMAFSTSRSQPDRPTLGVQLGNPGNGVDIVVAPSMAQCEPFLVYYNISAPVSPFIAFYTTDLHGDALLTIDPPASAAGYIDWICNIPAGHSLVVASRDDAGTLRGEFYVVQAGSSSSCLADFTATYSIANYGPNFQSYTSLDIPSETASFTTASVTDFPSFAFPTITANPISTDGPTTIASPTPRPRKRLVVSSKVAIALGIVGWVLMVVLLTICVWRMGRSSRATRVLHDKPHESMSRSDSNNLPFTPPNAQHSVGDRSTSNTATASTPPAQTSGRPAALGHHAHGSIANASINSGGDLDLDLDLEASQLTSHQLPTLLAYLIASNAAPSTTSGQSLLTPSKVSSNTVRDKVHSANVEAVPDTISSAQPNATEMDGVGVGQSTRVGVTDEEIPPQPMT